MMYSRRQRGEGKDLGGSQMRSRFESMEEKRIMREKLEAARKAVRSGSEPGFRNLPEITKMRDNAAAAKEKMANVRETPEMVAKRIRERRGR